MGACWAEYHEYSDRDFSVRMLRLCIRFDFVCATSIQDIYIT
jgi:hypothetical protein